MSILLANELGYKLCAWYTAHPGFRALPGCDLISTFMEKESD